MKKIKNITVLTSEVDSQMDKFDVKNIEFPNVVPLTEALNHEFMENLGTCELYKDNDKLKANIELPDKDFNDFYPAIQFTYDRKDVELDESIGVFKYNNIKLEAVGLCTSGNVDKSIKTIGEQIKENEDRSPNKS